MICDGPDLERVFFCWLNTFFGAPKPESQVLVHKCSKLVLPRMMPSPRSASASTSCCAISSLHAVASCASSASSLAGCRVTYLHAAASHPPAPPSLIALLPLVTLLLGLLSGCLSPSLSSRQHLPSAGASAYHLAVATHHAPFGPLVWLVVTSLLLMPPTPI